MVYLTQAPPTPGLSHTPHYTNPGQPRVTAGANAAQRLPEPWAMGLAVGEGLAQFGLL